MNNLQIPAWGIWAMLAGFAAFIGLLVVYFKRNHGLKRPIFASPYTLWIILFTVVPCILIAYYAFTDVNGQFTLDNFKNFWDSNYDARKTMGPELEMYLEMGFTAEDLGLGRGTVNVDTLVYSLWMAFLCTIICLVLGYPTAHIMADREFKLGSTLVILFVIPMWMNFLLRTIAWMSILEDTGLINQVLGWFGLGPVKLMYNSGAVLLGMVYNYLPFMVFPIYNVLNKMDYKLSEAAMDLGCNKWRTFYKVTLPLSLPGVVSGITMVFMPAVTTFFIPRLLGGGSTEMFGDLIERTFLTANNWNVGSALSLLMMVLILLSLGLLRKVDPDGEGGSMI